MFFAKPWPMGEFLPAGMFSGWHWLLFALTAVLVTAGLILSRNMTQKAVRRTVRIVTALLWALEIVKISFVLLVLKSRNPNEFIPLYYCSLVLYAGIMSSLGRGFMRRMGDCFLATGSIVGGTVFLLLPTTSLPRYPAFHFISLHSFLLHGLMVYLGLLLLLRLVYRPKLKDIWYCVTLISVVCALAFVFNTVYDSVTGRFVANLMFISKDFPETPITILYRVLGPLFTPFMWLVQAFGPFLLVYWGVLLVRRMRKKSEVDEI